MQTVKVWDPIVRLFHWSLVLSFAIAYISEDKFLTLHVIAGYIIAGLIAFRLVWGLVGSRYARFSDFVKKPKVIKAYLQDIMHFKATRYLGHNPAGGAMVLMLLLTLSLTSFTGILLYGMEEHAGPLSGLVEGWPHFLEELLEGLHELMANLTLLLVFVHVGGVLLASFQHGENLISSMINGQKTVKNQQ